MGGGVCRCEAVIVEAAEVGWREDVVPVGGGGTQAVASAHAHCGACASPLQLGASPLQLAASPLQLGAEWLPTH